MIIMSLFIVIWILCGVLSYGISLAYFQRQYPSLAKECYREDVRDSLVMSSIGPFGLLSTLLVFGTKHGVMFAN